MATTYTLKRKTFADPNQSGEKKKGMSTGAKIAAGIGTAALAYGAARRGAFGVGASRATNRIWGQAGQKLQKSGFEGLQKVGTNMEKNALKTHGRVVYNNAQGILAGSGSTKEIKRLAGQEAREATSKLLAPKP